MYLLVAIEITSLLRHRISNKVWHSIHLLSYFLFGLVTIHFVTAGTDAKAILATSAAVLIGTTAAFGSAALYLWRTDPGPPRAVARGRRPSQRPGLPPGRPRAGPPSPGPIVPRHAVPPPTADPLARLLDDPPPTSERAGAYDG